MTSDIPTNIMVLAVAVVICSSLVLSLFIYLTFDEKKNDIMKLGVYSPVNEPVSDALSSLPVTPSLPPPQPQVPHRVPEHLLEAARSVVYIGKADLAQINALLSYVNEPYRGSARIDMKIMGIARGVIDLDAAAYPKKVLEDLRDRIIAADKYDT